MKEIYVALFSKDYYSLDEINNASDEEIVNMLDKDEDFASYMSMAAFQEEWNYMDLCVSPKFDTSDTYIRFFSK